MFSYEFEEEDEIMRLRMEVLMDALVRINEMLRNSGIEGE